MAILTHMVKGSGDALGHADQGKAGIVRFEIKSATTNIADSSVVKLMKIPAKTLIEDVVAYVKTAEGATLTIDVGDYLVADDSAVDADGFLDGVNGNSVATTKTSDELAEDTTTLGYAPGKYYPTETSYLAVLFNDAAATAEIHILVKFVNCE